MASGNPKNGPKSFGPAGEEILRWVLLLGAALWLASPYFSPVLIGTGDALWYHHLLADAVQQFRAGVFPVYVGQGEFMFNGAVYPHRVAPYHQYFAGLIDLLTGRTLSFFALQHLTIILSFVGGAFGAYFSLSRLTPQRKWDAALLAVLYLACPGVIGLAYAQDLYMSVMTLPWVPLALGGAWLSFQENSWRSLAMMTIGLAALWWSHSPIAMWVTFIVGLSQLVRLAVTSARRPLLVRGLPAAALLALLIAYPVTSAFLLRAPGESVVPYVMDRALLLKEIHDAFPASLQPLNPAASPLSQLQLGYGLWLVLAALTGLTLWRRRAGSGLALLLAALLLVLVLPVPGLTRALWLSFPEPVVGLSLYWPMQRLYVIIAGLLVIGIYSAVSKPSLPRPLHHVFTGLLIVAALWSVREAGSFQRTARERAAANANSTLWAHSENVTPMRHAYHLFGRQPATMSHGVMHPQSESRLLDPVTSQPLALPPASAASPQLFTGTLDANPGILNLQPALTLEPGRLYELTLEFLDHDYTGVLQITGPGFFREYGLPASGNRRAFGTGPDAARSLPLWTTQPNPVELQLRFIPTQPGVRAETFSPFARFHFQEVSTDKVAIALESLIPYRARVQSPQAALLETPRMSVPGYTATVGGAPVPVRKTPEGFVAVPVPAGTSLVEVKFTGPWMLRAAFWISALAWLLALLACAALLRAGPGAESAP